MLELYREEIIALLEQRDRALEAWCRRHPGADPRVDPLAYHKAGGREVLSQQRIDLAARLDGVQRDRGLPRGRARCDRRPVRG